MCDCEEVKDNEMVEISKSELDSLHELVGLLMEDVPLDVEKIIYNDRRTIVYWNDGTKNMTTASSDEIFDLEVGLAICLMKKMFGKKVYGKRLYKRMINKAQTQDYESREVLDEWREERYG